MSYVEIHGFSKRFRANARPVFDDISFTLEQGEFVTLLGPSGCGKSTLLRCIAGLTPVDSGRMLIGNEEMTRVPPQRRGIGMVFQSYALFPNLSVADNVAFGLRMHGRPRDEIARRVARAIAMVEMDGRENDYPAQLSGGQRQRVALARALVVEPRILLLDEPLSALDARIRKHLRTQIRAIQQELGLTTIFVTHDQEEALQLSDRIFVMNQGAIVQQGSAEAIYTRPANAFVARFMGSYNLLEPQQAEQVFGWRPQHALAVRPESILMTEGQGERLAEAPIALDGRVTGHQLLGNIVRYGVAVGDTHFEVDRLNRDPLALLAPGTEVSLHLRRDDLCEVAD